MGNYNTRTLGLIICAIVVFVLLVNYGWKATQNISASVKPRLDDIAQKQMDNFAQCLASKKITMYGATWCTQCKKEKLAFGSSFTYVPYVECPDNVSLCTEKKILVYPTWITENGVLYEGEQGLETLSMITGCPMINTAATTSTTVSETEETVSSATVTQ